jgi:hypothetical protein
MHTTRTSHTRDPAGLLTTHTPHTHANTHTHTPHTHAHTHTPHTHTHTHTRTRRTQEAAQTGQIDAANAELASAQQTAKMKEGDMAQLERRRNNLHQQVRGASAARC